MILTPTPRGPRWLPFLALWPILASVAVPHVSAEIPSPLEEPKVQLERLQARVANRYAAYVFETYRRCEELAVHLREELGRFVAKPDAEALDRAREAWLAARRVYGRTEVFRFYRGPIDDPVVGVETLLNAWPLDELYIDSPETGLGIINDRERYPNLDGTLLVLLNERGGEANIAVGWHAVEFLLWGIDDNPTGPGQRSWQDFSEAHDSDASRRSSYLLLCADLLVQHHRRLRVAWDPQETDNYRQAFLALPPGQSFRKILAGMTILSGFELAGERLAVAYETQDQEEEHSCFSDNTHIDFLANQEGLLAVYLGSDAGGDGVMDVARAIQPGLATQLKEELQASLEAIRAMPVPFDQGILGNEGDPGRRAILQALVRLERQAESLGVLAGFLGYDIALQPGG